MDKTKDGFSEVRYPNFMEIEVHHMKKAIEHTILIRSFILNKLSLHLGDS